jgi:hypothetical protein
VLETNCGSKSGCHDATTGKRLDDYDHVVLYVNSGQLEGSLIGDENFLAMPPGGKLDSCSLKTILNWIHQGKRNN